MCNENSLQPRTVITIIAADDNGFHATVTYEGEPGYRIGKCTIYQFADVLMGSK